MWMNTMLVYYITPGAPGTHGKELQYASNIWICNSLQHDCNIISGVESDVNIHKDKD